MESYTSTAKSKGNTWPTATPGRPCPVCGKENRCRVAPDGTAASCFRNGNNGKVVQLKNKYYRNNNGHPKNGRAAKSRSRSYPSAEEAISAAGRFVRGGEPTNVWTYPGDVARVARFDRADGGKEFRPVHHSAGNWYVGDPPGPWPLYHGDKLPDAGNIYVVEGEKCADLARSIGLKGVTSSHGSGGAAKSDWSSLFHHNGTIVLIPDNDDAGEKYVRTVARIILTENPNAFVKILRLPCLPVGGDIEQFIKTTEGGKKDARLKIKRLEKEAEALEHTSFMEGPVLVCAADVQPTEIKWLWPGRIPLGRITLLVGQPGLGKSFLTCDMAARVTTQRRWPDDKGCAGGSVIFICSEDDLADTIRPRLDAHGANVNRVHILSMVRRIGDDGKPFETMFTLTDVAMLSKALKEKPDCKLIVIDPIGSFIGCKVDAHRDNEVRAVLAPVAKLAQDHGVAVLIVAHRRKAAGTFADDLAIGSKAFTAFARAVIHLSRDPQNEDRRFLLPGKSNLTRKVDGLAFTIPDWPTGVPPIEWENDPVKMSADEALADEQGNDGPGRPTKQKAEASKWLQNQLADGKKHSVKRLEELAKDESDSFSWRSVRRASGAMSVEKSRRNFGGEWFWSLPARNINGHSGPQAVTR